MAGASVEATLELWASSLRDVKARIRPLFSQERVAVSAGKFLDGLPGNEPRKTGWMRATHPTCPRHRLVTLAARSPGRGAPCSPQEKRSRAGALCP
jgi:hypothetical protein